MCFRMLLLENCPNLVKLQASETSLVYVLCSVLKERIRCTCMNFSPVLSIFRLRTERDFTVLKWQEALDLRQEDCTSVLAFPWSFSREEAEMREKWAMLLWE